MKATETGLRGQPLLLLVLLLCGWGVLRAALWESPLLPVAELGRSVLPGIAASAGSPSAGSLTDSRGPPAVAYVGAPAWGGATSLAQATVDGAEGRISKPLPLLSGPAVPLKAGTAGSEWGAAIAEGLYPTARPQPAGVPARPQQLRLRRFSADGWLFMRSGGGSGGAGALRPGYGGSQAGATLRYSLGAGSSHRPQFHVRASAALAGSGREREGAAGISARPIPQLPLRLTAELRAAHRDNDGADFRPSAFAVTEIAPITLPLAAQAEFYLQVGYVGGRFATAFIDGQARAERPVARFGSAEILTGAAAWGGAQRAAGRLDVGPSASLRFPAGGGYARLSVDYRIRIAGGAAPASGPALTLSAGF